ncbi:flagellar hook-associated protein FlgL [Sphingomonas tabacisoli]|uniref:Flagellar hook-associated protein FlgL n=1 Tax=Sphingomonas tabacisoli TaxID=2249466 RepID=A0ABW4HX86_9SPHN
MKIGTAYFFDSRNRQMADLSGLASKIQEQISTGKRILTPSDDPVVSARLARMATGASNDTQSASNVKLAQSLLGQGDTALESVANDLQRAQELLVRAGSDTLNDDNRAALAAELKSIVDNLYSTANTTDVRGTALFGGSGSGAAYTRAADGTISYAGEGEAPPIPIGNGVNVQATDSGARIFGNIQAGAGTKDVFQIVGDLAAALDVGGSATPAARQQALADASDGLKNALERVNTARASIGARGARLDIESERLSQAANDYQIDRGNLEGVDVQAAVTDLQKTMLTLQATQASFSKLSQLSLFDYIN